jgi:5-methylcytosine-specific restriction endonuclease McrA
MIRLRRHHLPIELQVLARERTESLLECLRQRQEPPDSLKSAYRDTRVKAILRAETYDKCAYCESKIAHIYFGDVEHIIPKSVRPDLTFEHANLAFVCAMCNNNKGAFYDPSLPLLNP